MSQNQTQETPAQTGRINVAIRRALHADLSLMQDTLKHEVPDVFCDMRTATESAVLLLKQKYFARAKKRVLERLA